nr:MAG TPA: hypothetical protein [Inoviridae sp.]
MANLPRDPLLFLFCHTVNCDKHLAQKSMPHQSG